MEVISRHPASKSCGPRATAPLCPPSPAAQGHAVQTWACACLCLVRHGLRPGHVAWAVMPRVPGRSRKVLDPSSQRESMGGSAEHLPPSRRHHRKRLCSCHTQPNLAPEARKA